MLDSVKNFAADITSATIQWIDAGYDLTKVPDEVQALRIKICESCPAGKFEQKDRRCTSCGCPNMDFKASLKYDPIESGLVMKKTLITCPENYW
jgi:hypothetical protein